MTWRWPLPGNLTPPPTRGGGAFGTVRKHEVHTGVDLYCEPDQQVVAVQGGWVAMIVAFTGDRAGSPWWFDTDAVIVDSGEDGCVLYGEIRPDLLRLGVGTRVEAGRFLGRVQRARRNDDGKPTTMLHLELWQSKQDVLCCYSGTRWRDPNDWPLGGEKPAGLLDPTGKLYEALNAEMRGRNS